MWNLTLSYFLVLFVQSSSVFIKCCPHGYAFSENLRCVMIIAQNSDIAPDELHFGNGTQFTETCYRSGEGVGDSHDDRSRNDRNITTVEKCVDVDQRNGTIHTRSCPIDWRERLGKCDSVFKPLFFWGASIVVFANIVYIFPYLIVVVFFFAIADLRNRAYDKAVLSYNASHLAITLILAGMGYFVLCHEPIRPIWLYKVLGLILQFLLTAAAFWLNVICFDMTLVITRFRWIPGSDVTGSEDKRKFRMYAAYAWGGGTIITAITGFVELCPWIPTSSPLKPNFERFDDGANYAVILHVSVVPVITLVLNNGLFIYTTRKVDKIRKSAAIANKGNSNVRKKYFVFLRLYILMDAPWIVEVTAAAYSGLWILKFYRMVQPILMLFAIVPKRKFCHAMTYCKTPVTNTTSRTKTNGCEMRY